MRNKILRYMIVVVFLLGLLMMLYPTFSNWYNEKMNSYVVSNYANQILATPQEDYEQMMEEARVFNKTLTGGIEHFEQGSLQEEEYLKVFGAYQGIIGYVDIEEIDVRLPIYHGTDEAVLQKAVGHLEGSHFPTGDIGNHTILTGHTGLPSAKLFTGLIELEVGDTFELHVLDQIFTYEVFAIHVVEPTEIDLLDPVEGRDLVTLVTCTPYGINTHRLLVQGERILLNEEVTSPSEQDEESSSTTDVEQHSVENNIIKSEVIAIVAFIWTLLLVVIIVIYIKKRKEGH